MRLKPDFCMKQNVLHARLSKKMCCRPDFLSNPDRAKCRVMVGQHHCGQTHYIVQNLIIYIQNLVSYTHCRV